MPRLKGRSESPQSYTAGGLRPSERPSGAPAGAKRGLYVHSEAKVQWIKIWYIYIQNKHFNCTLNTPLNTQIKFYRCFCQIFNKIWRYTLKPIGSLLAFHSAGEGAGELAALAAPLTASELCLGPCLLFCSCLCPCLCLSLSSCTYLWPRPSLCLSPCPCPHPPRLYVCRFWYRLAFTATAQRRSCEEKPNYIPSTLQI